MHIPRRRSGVHGSLHGLHPIEDKVEAIQKARAPENVLGSEVVLGFATAAEFPKSERTPLIG